MSDQNLADRLRALADEAEGTSLVEQAQAAANKVEDTISKFRATLQTCMDNIAWIAGLPAVFGGGFGFLKSNADGAASTDWQIEQLTERVAEIEAGNDLLGGGTKNWSLNLGDAPGGSLTTAFCFLAIGILVAGAVWWQKRRI